MRAGHGESGKAVFDFLLDSKADPSMYARQPTRYNRIRHGAFPYLCPLTAGITTGNVEMCMHSMAEQ